MIGGNQRQEGALLMRRVRLSLLVLLLSLPVQIFAKDVYLSVGGSANGFFTDARIFNPSFDEDITIAAYYLPAGNSDNAGVQPKTITVARRSMVAYDDVVNSLFGGGPALGAIRLTSDDDFVATQRIYADRRAAAQRGTLGQFVPGLDVTTARNKGVVPQLKSGQATLGAFRTNWGGVNPNASVANVDFELYDKNNQLAGTNRLTIQPFGVIGPTNITGFFGNPTVDLSDAWFSFVSDKPIFVYGSVVDNGSTDPTFVPAFEDTGVKPVEPPPPPPAPTVTIVAEDFRFIVTRPTEPIRVGTQVRMLVSKSEGLHALWVFDPDNQRVLDTSLPFNPTERLLTVSKAGTYTMVCSNSGCGSGHFSMVSEFTVIP
jgi:hypothetical protein